MHGCTEGSGIMKEIDDALNALINVIKTTKEYNQYQTLLKKVKNEPELYGRICDYRRKSLALQLSDNENFIQENNNLQNEFADLLNIGLSNEYFAAEHQYCVMIRKIQECYLEEISIETGFLEG